MGPESSLMSHGPSAFGEDSFGRRAEAAARFFGTPKYIVGQTVLVIAWIAVNAVASKCASRDRVAEAPTLASVAAWVKTKHSRGACERAGSVICRS